MSTQDIGFYHKLAAISGASAVILGAYGAHGLKAKDPYFHEVFRRANHYHLIHSFLFLAAPLTKIPSVVTSLTVAGITLFSGSCYAVALKESRKFGRFAPFGGMAFICAWLSLAWD
mmetsp:Transcript_21300/g.38065  ORF Transcript_21300/g.38065 Transcript_21300/m.38065 type:complete len:116 (+) Transcript_21300:81-428(+)|eukprot:CAMPEP_0175038868 /NCGR_PEP_ID=MMETSP0052_2-20121109/157_1 /TAXON_ID=51329 ORGANISM="Polytomella parva, Strain SAG 63-3" /NCGR_SAMPLE_ID=MMETSP0052_2 /ASSEMBLY_ACC=CAM_ASM_000194 /LENGTH=115 /DNA_ID=CAMNT_0016300437 /DNA_START=78 /DNA_END=425 /DNA_ORIENTATION=-